MIYTKIRFFTIVIKDPFALLHKIFITSLLGSAANAQSRFVAEDGETFTELSSAAEQILLF